jgi:hypothetical protein
MIELKEKFTYNGDYNDIVTIDALKERVIINAICFTNNLHQASMEAGVGQRALELFLKEYNINHEVQKLMRVHFKATGKKVKKRFNYE